MAATITPVSRCVASIISFFLRDPSYLFEAGSQGVHLLGKPLIFIQHFGDLDRQNPLVCWSVFNNVLGSQKLVREVWII